MFHIEINGIWLCLWFCVRYLKLSKFQILRSIVNIRARAFVSGNTLMHICAPHVQAFIAGNTLTHTCVSDTARCVMHVLALYLWCISIISMYIKVKLFGLYKVICISWDSRELFLLEYKTMCLTGRPTFHPIHFRRTSFRPKIFVQS